MSRDTDPVEYQCPHCGQGYAIEAHEAIFIDDVDDECATQCESCKGWYQLRCLSVEIDLDATKAKHARGDQSDD